MLPSELTFKNKHRTLEKQVNDVEFMKQNPQEYKKTVQEFRYLTEVLAGYAEVRNLEKQLKEALSLRQGEPEAELLALVEEEVAELEQQLDQTRLELQTLLLPKDENLGRNVIIEIRAGTGGEEACLFVADLLRMYERLAEKKKWQLAPLSASRSKLKGFKEIIFSLKGKTAYENMKFETGIHRVQRIPQTEASGRVHTSAISVAVLPEVGESEVKVSPEALKIDTYRASGAGGQHVNTTDSAIRITHLPTGLVVTCQDERSQIKNREKALRILRAKLHEKKTSEEKKKRDEARKEQVGSGDRSEKIRTYNFPQGRVTDHRSGLTLYRLEDFLNGEVEEMVASLKQAEVKEKMKQAH